MIKEFTKIKAIVWDIGAVIYLVKNKLKRESKNLLNSNRELWILLKSVNVNDEKLFKQFKEIYFKSTKGELSKKETLNSLSRLLNLSVNNVNKIFSDVIKKNVVENKVLINFILKLKNQGYKQGILSIQWFMSNDILIPKKYYSIFEEEVVSCIDHVRKPNPEAFKLILKKMNVLPEQTIFVDDKQENVNAARELGIKAVLFVNNQKLKEEFDKMGVK